MSVTTRAELINDRQLKELPRHEMSIVERGPQAQDGIRRLE
ncbi:hypothetical protein MTBSS4_830001 [Magnetospirillum sp. SS-4]|nr:hypothetical protein MTBSS4_830001 [Magnetospirillum sp. SS-4]